MPSSAPPPGSPGAPPRRGMGGVLGLLAVVALAILAAVIFMRRAPETVTEAPTPSTIAPSTTLAPAATPAPAEPVRPVTEPAAPAPAPAGKPRPPRRARTAPAPAAPKVADSSRPGPAAAPPTPAPRRFLMGTTSIESLKPVGREIKGFESGGVGVKRAPEVNGRVELEVDPPQVRPGVDYTVKVYLANDGSRDIPVREVKVQTVENGKSASRNLTPRTRSVKPRQRVLLDEVSGVWREAAHSWAMDVVVTSGRQDVYRNSLRWE
jgi:hypothetical protein